MKKISFLLSVLLIMFVAASNNAVFAADESDYTLVEMVEEMNDDCPIEMGEGMEITRMEIQPSAVVFYCTLDGDDFELDPSMYAVLKPVMKSAMNESYKQITKEEEEFAFFVRLIVKEKKGINFHFTTDDGANSAQPLILEFSPSEVKGWL